MADLKEVVCTADQNKASMLVMWKGARRFNFLAKSASTRLASNFLVGKMHIRAIHPQGRKISGAGTLLGKQQSMSSIQLIIREDQNKSEDFFLALARENNSKLLYQTLEDMEISSIPITEDNLKHFFDACKNSKDSKSAYAQIMKYSKKVENPSLSLYTDALIICGQAGDIKCASQV
jgi:hypothetical protein